MTEIAGWIAPLATMIAAMMTAANLGARVTGWGFVVFTLGSLSWSTIGLASGQTNLLATNAFLTLVNLVGIWRWLGRQRSYEDGGKSAEQASRRSSTPDLLTATGIAGLNVVGSKDEAIGKSVEALVECRSGRISYVVVSRTRPGSLSEELRAVPFGRISVACDQLTLDLTPEDFAALPTLEDGDWPVAPPPCRADECPPDTRSNAALACTSTADSSLPLPLPLPSTSTSPSTAGPVSTSIQAEGVASTAAATAMSPSSNTISSVSNP